MNNCCINFTFRQFVEDQESISAEEIRLYLGIATGPHRNPSGM
jgi:hypothetical protein